MTGLPIGKFTLSPELRSAMWRIGVAALAFVFAVYGLVLRPLREGHALDAEIAAGKTRLAQAQAMAPVLTSLERDEQNATLKTLLPPQSAPIPRMSVYLTPQKIGRMAKRLGVDPINVALDPASLAQDPNAIRLTGVFSGAYPQCRALLVTLGALPSLARMEHVEMRAVDGHIEMMVQLRIALKD